MPLVLLLVLFLCRHYITKSSSLQILCQAALSNLPLPLLKHLPFSQNVQLWMFIHRFAGTNAQKCAGQMYLMTSHRKCSPVSISLSTETLSILRRRGGTTYLEDSSLLPNQWLSGCCHTARIQPQIHQGVHQNKHSGGFLQGNVIGNSW